MNMTYRNDQYVVLDEKEAQSGQEYAGSDAQEIEGESTGILPFGREPDDPQDKVYEKQADERDVERVPGVCEVDCPSVLVRSSQLVQAEAEAVDDEQDFWQVDVVEMLFGA
jgi:hypothetical protein